MMISSINANGINVVNSGYNNIKASASVNTSDEKTGAIKATASNEENVVATSEDGDTVSISKKSAMGGVKKTFTASSKQDTVSEDKGYTDSTAAALSSAAAGAGIDSTTQVKNSNANAAAVSSSSSSSSSSTDTSNLSSYTAYELKEMLLDGEITQAEYDEEIANRQENVSESDSSEETVETATTAQTDPTAETVAAQQAGIVEG